MTLTVDDRELIGSIAEAMCSAVNGDKSSVVQWSRLHREERELYEIAARAALNTPRLQSLLSDRDKLELRVRELEASIRSFKRADTEFSRARNSAEQPRLSNAGTRYQCAKWKLFRAALTQTEVP